MTDVHTRISDLNHLTNHQCRGDKQHPVEPQATLSRAKRLETAYSVPPAGETDPLGRKTA